MLLGYLHVRQENILNCNKFHDRQRKKREEVEKEWQIAKEWNATKDSEREMEMKVGAAVEGVRKISPDF